MRNIINEKVGRGKFYIRWVRSDAKELVGLGRCNVIITGDLSPFVVGGSGGIQ